jgi:hypothetical protein
MDNNNAFFNDTNTLYEQCMSINCKNINKLEEFLYQKNMDKLKNDMNYKLVKRNEIRNVDLERPMMWCENRFKHFNYCTVKNINGFYDCNDYKRTRFNSNSKLNNPINNICGFNLNNNSLYKNINENINQNNN